MKSVYLLTLGERHEIESLAQVLPSCLQTNSVISRQLMLDRDIVDSRWIGFHFGKGVTSYKRDLSVFTIPANGLITGLHAEMLAGLPGLDQGMQCYDKEHTLGFGDFIRWVYFVDPHSSRAVLGVDFSLAERPTSGVANTIQRVARVARACNSHGMPPETELALLNPRMCEESYHREYREESALITVADWCDLEPFLCGPQSTRCPRCGLATRTVQARYCCRCGCDFKLVEE